ncbi:MULTISPECIES: glycosyltransferase [Okeania]|uniref:Glycosyl transferase family 1 n=1 Tax=Okeania hirsuta TaxID=1458930 RepID=A0A3N6P9F1_9CYAN|nr:MULTISPECIES: glycosyltransferase [Okeania]NES75855.1 glycosyltransferase [Okeania sp. SIO1H4]NET20040.1 glycosyltransferase [Okeania sp. SIO1H5]NET75548.1 glycosyltransferase [Okeania sp. SIO1F9]NET91874.1 glycosyltransferase [Okeania sp. SIO1H2]RQH24990.1 glycosyl transferase family 1 [Okeania hirsuta]
MTHFGAICPTQFTGHLNTMLPLAQELKRRGHRVTFIGIVGYEAKVLAAGLEYLDYGQEDLSPEAMKKSLYHLSQLSGIAALRYGIQLKKNGANVLLKDAPQLIKNAGIDALLIDSISIAGGTIADLLEIPFITICSAVVFHLDYAIPPHFKSWEYNPTLWGKLRNLSAYTWSGLLRKPVRDLIAEYRRQWNLPLYSHPNDVYSQLAQISQQPAELEFPRENLPKWFHFTGPYHYSGTREPVPFPWDKLTGKPLIYASLGSLVNRFIDVFDKIAAACDGLDAQLVMSLGGSATPESLPNLPGNPLVVKYAPQLELLQKVTLTITHAGMNTTLECLNNGVPMIAIPIALDQPGIAARIAWSGAGEAIPLKRLTVERLRTEISQVLTQPSYKQNALRLQSAIKRSGGVTRAADIIEQAVSTGKPVLAETIN